MKIIERRITDYIISSYAGKNIIKVLVGIRRCGKSFILRQIRDKVKSMYKYTESEVIYIDFEDMKNRSLLDSISLFEHIKNIIDERKLKKVCLLFDEIQEVDNWQKCVNSFYSDEDIFTDIYITGSNAKLLSGELSTLVSGRFVNINIFPLSYQEFLKLNEYDDNEKAFGLYMRYGGFPGLSEFMDDENALKNYLGGIYSTVLVKDVITRNKIRDVSLLEDLIKYIFENTGNIFSGKRIHDFLKNQKRSLSVETIYNYLTYLSNALCIHKVKRCDIKGKEILETMEKYYPADWGLRYYLFGFEDNAISGVLENIVFIELLRRGWEVKIGKLESAEVDFIAEKGGEKHYIQVSYLTTTPATREREYAPLLKIKDNFPKTLLTLDPLPESNENGITRMNIRDFLQN